MADWKKLVGSALRHAAEETLRTSLRKTGGQPSRRVGGARTTDRTGAPEPTTSRTPSRTTDRTNDARPRAGTRDPQRTETTALSRSPRSGGYPGDFTGRPTLAYAPREDGRPDPGEVVWTWVPYEEDHTQGKDRPVLLIGADGPWLLGLQLTSKDHDLDEAQEASRGRYWMDIGTGTWDREGRASEVRLNRIIRVDPATVRRTADRLDERRFAEVARGVLQYY